MQMVLRVWFLATALLVAGVLIWSFVPVLVPMLGVTAGIGVLVAGIVAFARWIERKRGMGSRE